MENCSNEVFTKIKKLFKLHVKNYKYIKFKEAMNLKKLTKNQNILLVNLLKEAKDGVTQSLC